MMYARKDENKSNIQSRVENMEGSGEDCSDKSYNHTEMLS